MIERSRYPFTNIDHPAISYIVIDLEWNQPIPWIKTNVDPKDLPGEIIEIGAVKLSLTQDGYELSKPFHVMIRPVCYTVMNKNVSRVTNKISSDLRFGLSFSDAYDAFRQWCGKDYILCGWGNSDLSILKSNLLYHKWKADLNTQFLDVQPLFARVAEGMTHQRSVEYAVDFLHIPKNDDFHAAHRDAEYTGLILKEIFNLLDQARTPATGRQYDPADLLLQEMKTLRLAAYLQNPDLHAETSKRTGLYPSWEQCFDNYPKDEECCPACLRLLSCRISWFRLKKSGFSLWCCEDHHMVLGRMRMKKTPDGKVYASVIIRLTDPGSSRLVTERYDEYLLFGSQGQPVIPHTEETAKSCIIAPDEEALQLPDLHHEKNACSSPGIISHNLPAGDSY